MSYPGSKRIDLFVPVENRKVDYSEKENYEGNSCFLSTFPAGGVKLQRVHRQMDSLKSEKMHIEAG